MSVVKIRPKRQVTIPKEVFSELHLETGDFIEATVEDGKIVMIPKRLAIKTDVIRLTEKEQEILFRATRKTERIKEDIIHSEGLSLEEIELAVKVGLIDRKQAWWWTEEWQKGERQVEREIKEGKLYGPFETFEEFKATLKKRK